MAEVQHGAAPSGARTARRPSEPRASRKVGYVVTAAVDLVLLWVVNNLLEWGWPPVLTDEFRDLLPWIDASLVATAVVNIAWVCWDPLWFKQLAQVALNAISLVVAVETWRIFPFDFSGYWSGWETVARVLIGIGCFGLVVDTIVKLVSLTRSAVGASTSSSSGEA